METRHPGNTFTHPNYRPDIDGLRAIAVLAVIGFHAFPTWVRGGFVGVDVFFVISGYLISTILFTSLERSPFSFAQFYIRRIKRIFPALIVLLLICLVAGWFALGSIEYMLLGRHVAGSAAFVSNLVLWSEAGYFDKSAETKPLLHLWSLGIEEQFYIVWPLLLYLTWKRKVWMLALLLVLLLTSFALNLRTVRVDKIADYYSPFTRFWELMTGAVLAYLSLYRPVPDWIVQTASPFVLRMIRAITTSSPTICNIKAVTGALLIMMAILVLSATNGYPGWWALLPVVGTYLIISAGSNAWFNNKLLANRALVAIGLISYPLYLWHWPLLSFPRVIEGRTPPEDTRVLAIFVSVVLAWLTYLLVEKPIRFGKATPIKAFLLLGLMGIIGSTGYYAYIWNTFSVNDDILAAAKDFDYETNGIYADTGIDSAFIIGKLGANETVLIGDSTMQQYIPRVRRLAEQHSIDLDRNRIAVVFKGGCLPVPDIMRDADPGCAEFVDKIIPTLNRNTVETVAIAAFWTNHFRLADFYLRSDGPNELLRDSETARKHAMRNLVALMSRLVQSGKRVFIILETPTSWKFEPQKMLPTGWDRLFGSKLPSDPPTREEMESYNREMSTTIQAAAEAIGARVIKPMDFLCDAMYCPGFTKEGRLMYFNYDHLRASFVRESATYIDQIFGPTGNTAMPSSVLYAR
jgi:peptidoglycan/LPS O-acetylase OafA/YrhL